MFPVPLAATYQAWWIHPVYLTVGMGLCIWNLYPLFKEFHLILIGPPDLFLKSIRLVYMFFIKLQMLGFVLMQEGLSLDHSSMKTILVQEKCTTTPEFDKFGSVLQSSRHSDLISTLWAVPSDVFLVFRTISWRPPFPATVSSQLHSELRRWVPENALLFSFSLLLLCGLPKHSHVTAGSEL